MSDRADAASIAISLSPENNRGAPLNSLAPRLTALGRDYVKDVLGGLVASVVLIANIVSFGALMFPGELSVGIPIAIWAMLIGSCVCGTWIAITTSLPPIATGIDSPTGAVLVLLSAATGTSVMRSGGTPQDAVQTVMLAFTAATLATGVMFYALGACRWGSYFRFVPYFVVGGFLTATGCFLIAGAMRMVTGQRSLAPYELIAGWTITSSAKLTCAAATFAALLLLRRYVKSPFALPAALVAMWLSGIWVLHSLGLSDPERGWYFHSLGTLTSWFPFEAARKSHFTVSMLPTLIPEVVAVTIVSLISLVTKVSSIEITRQTAGDLDRELRSHGFASVLAAPCGGITSSLQVATSRLCEQIGATRASGFVSALILGMVGLANFNMPGLIPIPIIAGLVVYLGYNFIVEACWRSYVQRAWLDLLLVMAIAVVCIFYGYLVGVLAGLICACLLFVVSYSRLGVVRRHLSRAQFASYVDRSPEASAFLRTAGDAIQLYRLSGYIFFGSSESVFERIRADIDSLQRRRVYYVILDFAMVSGADSSAFVSLAKIRNYCEQHRATLVCCSLSPANHTAMTRGGFFGAKSRHRYFDDLNLALAWCEDQMLTNAGMELDSTVTSFECWLQRQLGAEVSAQELMKFLVRKDFEKSQTIYRQGEPADTIDLVAVGHLLIEIAHVTGQGLRVRRTATHTVIGEMGFFRKSPRSATVSSDGASVLFTLTRDALNRMRRDRADLANALDDFIMRVLADRIDSANRQVAALEPSFSHFLPEK